MDASSGDRSSPRGRQQLQGPRPPRLAVSKDSHKVRKPPVAPQRHQQPPVQAQQHHQYQQQHHHHHQAPPQHHPQQPRAPVIIYDASPKVIHAKPGDFMALVQRLTGPGSSSAASQAQFDAAAAASGGAGPSGAAAGFPPPQPHHAPMDTEPPLPLPLPLQPREFLLSPTAALSPAARLAAIERSVRPLPQHAAPPPALPPYYYYAGGGAAGGGMDDFLSAADSEPSLLADVDAFAAALGAPTPGGRPGILSPAALPPAASTGLFSPLPFDPAWLGDLMMSPFLASAGTRAEQAPFAAAPSPRGGGLLLATPTMPSPATFSVLEFFQDL